MATAGQVLTAIIEAFRQGDMSAAVEVLWLAIKLAWQTVITEITVLWLRAKYFFVGVAINMRFGALIAAVQVRYKLTVWWIELRARGRR